MNAGKFHSLQERAWRSTFSVPFASRRGAAILVVVGLMAILLITAVAFTIMMRIERGASANYRHMVAARQMLGYGLAQALADIDAQVANDWYPNWPAGSYSNGSRVVTEKAGVIFSVDKSVLTNTDINPARPLSYEALKYIPGGLLRQSVETAQPEWISVLDRQGNMVGRYSYVACNVSGLLDANYIGKTNRWVGADPGEIQIAPSLLPDVTNATLFAMCRDTNNPTTGSADVRYETMKEFTSLNRGLRSAVSNLEVFSYAPCDETAPDGKPKLYIGGDLSVRITDVTFSNRLREIATAILPANYLNHRGGTRSQQQLADEGPKRIDAFIRSLVEYTSGTSATDFCHPTASSVPMLSSVVWTPTLSWKPAPPATFITTNVFEIYAWNPFVGSLPPGTYTADVSITCTNHPRIANPAALNPTFDACLIPTSSSITQNGLPLTVSGNFLFGSFQKTYSGSVPVSYTNNAYNYNFSIGGNYPILFKVALKKNGSIVDQVPGDWSLRGIDVHPDNFTAQMVSKKVSSSFTGMVPMTLGRTNSTWAETFDPRCNWESDDLGYQQWWSDSTMLNSTTLPALTNNPTAFVPPRTSYGIFMKSILTAPSSLSVLNATLDGVGDTWNDSLLDQIKMYAAGRPLQTVGELGYIPLDNWFSMRLHARTNDSSHFMLPTISAYGKSFDYHPVFDYFTMTPTNQHVRRGLVNINTDKSNVLESAFVGMPVHDWATNFSGYGMGYCSVSQAVAVASFIARRTPEVGLQQFQKASDLALLPWGDSTLTNSLAACNKMDREAALRNSMGLFTARQQIYTIIVRADSFMAKFGFTDMQHGSVLGSAQAVYQVWRDPAPDSNGKHRCFVRLCKVLSQ